MVRKLRLWLLVVGILLLVLAFAFAEVQDFVDVEFGQEESYSVELNAGVTFLLEVELFNVPEDDLNTILVTYDSRARDRVFCAPSPVAADDDDVTFTCVIPPGDAFEGSIEFIAVDVNGDEVRGTELHLSVSYAEQWFDAKTVAKVGSSVSVGGYSVTIRSASFLYAVFIVGDSPVTAFVNEETKLADDLYVTFRGYDPDTREVFLVFRSHRPLAVSVQRVDYYLVAPRKVFYSEDNTAAIDVVTNCSLVEYRLKGSDEWREVSVSDGVATVVVEGNVSRVYFRCSDDESVASSVYLEQPPVVEAWPDENVFASWCASHGYIKQSECPKTDCSSYCAAHGWVKPPAGYTCEFVKLGGEKEEGVSSIFFGVLVLVVLAGLVYLYRTGRIKPPSLSRKKDILDVKKPVEEAGDIQ